MKTQLSNPSTQSLHRRQTFLQIWLPLGILLAAILILGVFIIISAVHGTPHLQQWTDAMLVVVIAPLCLIGLLCFIMLLAMVLLTGRLLEAIPPYSYLASLYIQLFSQRVKWIADKTVQPVFSLAGLNARLNALVNLFKKANEEL